MQLQSLGGADYRYVTTTSTHEIYRLDLAIGSALAKPDNLAIDHDNNIYIVIYIVGGPDRSG